MAKHDFFECFMIYIERLHFNIKTAQYFFDIVILGTKENMYIILFRNCVKTRTPRYFWYWSPLRRVSDAEIFHTRNPKINSFDCKAENSIKFNVRNVSVNELWKTGFLVGWSFLSRAWFEWFPSNGTWTRTSRKFPIPGIPIHSKFIKGRRHTRFHL